MRGSREVHTMHDASGKLTAQGRKISAANIRLALSQGRIAKHEVEDWARSFAKDYERTVEALAALPPRNDELLYRAYAAYDRQLASRLS
jgi:hypothetical protein